MSKDPERGRGVVVQEWRQGGRVTVREADRVVGRITKATVEGEQNPLRRAGFAK